jgi:transcriptional antiterminator Rof (Rho-off)
VRLLKFDLQQAKETLQLKLDQVKQLQIQVNDLKRNKNAESKKQIDSLQATVDLQSDKIAQLQSDLE